MTENETLEGSKVKQATAYQQRFREGRQLANASLKTVAEALGKSLQFIGQFEKGQNEITVAQFLAACAALNLRTDWVLHGTGEPFTTESTPVMGNRQRRAARRTPPAT